MIEESYVQRLRWDVNWIMRFRNPCQRLCFLQGHRDAFSSQLYRRGGKLCWIHLSYVSYFQDSRHCRTHPYRHPYSYHARYTLSSLAEKAHFLRLCLTLWQNPECLTFHPKDVSLVRLVQAGYSHPNSIQGTRDPSRMEEWVHGLEFVAN